MTAESSEYDLLTRRVLDNLSLAVLLFDEEHRLTFLNPAAEELLDISAHQLVGNLASELMNCPGGEVEALLSRALSSGEVVSERERYIALGAGREMRVDCIATPLWSPGYGHEVLIELRPIERQLRIAREEQYLAQHQASQALARGLAHEIKNPLGGLRGAAQLLERELPTEQLRDYTDVIIAEADRLLQLVDQMAGPRPSSNKVETNIHLALERVRILVQAEQANGVRVVNDYDPSVPEVQADIGQLVQALLNITRNAAQAIEYEGTVVLRSRIERNVLFGTNRHRLAARIDIEDNGLGVPEAMRESIFYPMVTGRSDGTGLGLSVAQSVINQHGGFINFTSRPGKTVFSIFLPLAQTSPDGRDEQA